jgi:hypothetical protein
MAPDPASLLGRALTPPLVLQLWTLRLCREGSNGAMRPMVPCGPHASSIKKDQVGLPVQQGS